MFRALFPGMHVRDRFRARCHLSAAYHASMSKPNVLPRPEPMEWSDIDQMHFPTRFTAAIDYFATGEGISVWIVMAFASSADDLRAAVLSHCDVYFADGARVWPRLVVPDVLQNFVPTAVAEVCQLPDGKVGRFEFAGRFHRNMS